jgi:hypothetical protein
MIPPTYMGGIVPAATAEKPLVATPSRIRTFMARRADLKLVIARKWDKKDGEGNVIETIPGKHVKFDEGVLRIPTGAMRGEHGETLDSGEVITFLLGDAQAGRLPHPLLNDRFDGFWEHVEPAPPPTEAERETLQNLAIDRDLSGIETLMRQEEAGWARPEFLNEAQKALDRAKAREAEAAPKAPKPAA